MDEALLKRLLGALVLLGAAFLLATLLPGPEPPAPGAGAIAAYDLRTGAPIRTTPVAEADPPATEVAREAPQAAAEVPLAPGPEVGPPPASAPVAPVGPRPALKVDESLETAPAPAEWYVQVGSYSSQANARGVLQKLFGLGMPTVIQSVSVGKNLWYRVRVGPYAAEAGARKALGTIRKEGYPTAKLVHLDSGTAPKGN